MRNKRNRMGVTEKEKKWERKSRERAVAFQEMEGYSHWTASGLDCVCVCIHKAALSHASMQTAQEVDKALARAQRTCREWKCKGERGRHDWWMLFLNLSCAFVFLYLYTCISFSSLSVLPQDNCWSSHVMSWLQLSLRSSVLQFLGSIKLNLSGTNLLLIVRDSEVNKKMAKFSVCVCVWGWLCVSPGLSSGVKPVRLLGSQWIPDHSVVYASVSYQLFLPALDDDTQLFFT